MTVMSLQDVGLDYPIASPDSLSIKRIVINLLRGRKTVTPTIRALNGLNITLNEGECIGLYGTNGAGKSSLLRVMAGIYPPSTGEIRRKGSVTSLLGLGLGANIELSAEDNIRLLLRFEGIDPDPEMIESIWAFTELDRKFLKLSLRYFSTGMMMRLFFGVSTSAKPEILLMDEWLSVVDEKFMHKAESRLRSFVGQARGVVLASHNIHLLREVCTRIVYLDAGEIVREEVIEREEVIL